MLVRIYFGVGNPNTFFYGELSALTVGKLIRMVGGNTASVPNAVAESGFPKGLLVRIHANFKIQSLYFILR